MASHQPNKRKTKANEKNFEKIYKQMIIDGSAKRDELESNYKKNY